MKIYVLTGSCDKYCDCTVRFVTTDIELCKKYDIVPITRNGGKVCIEVWENEQLIECITLKKTVTYNWK